MKNNDTRTATEAYSKESNDMRINLEALLDWVKNVAKKPEAANRADVGDLRKINGDLEEIIEFIGRDDY